MNKETGLLWYHIDFKVYLLYGAYCITTYNPKYNKQGCMQVKLYYNPSPLEIRDLAYIETLLLHSTNAVIKPIKRK